MGELALQLAYLILRFTFAPLATRTTDHSNQPTIFSSRWIEKQELYPKRVSIKRDMGRASSSFKTGELALQLTYLVLRFTFTFAPLLSIETWLIPPSLHAQIAAGRAVSGVP